MVTRTGGYRIGFRHGPSKWQKDLSTLARWARQQGCELIDLGQVSAADVKTVKDAGVDVVSADVLDGPALLSSDAGKRKDCIARNTAYFEQMAELGVRVFFTVLIPEDPDNDPENNFELAVQSYSPLADVADGLGVTIVLEGWPGPAPGYRNLCCNPET